MSFVLLKNYGHYVIVNDDADFIVGTVYPLNGQQGPYKVTSCIGSAYWRERNEIDIVKSLSDAIPAFIDHHKKNPVPWQRVSHALYKKETLFVSLRVEQDQQRSWLVYRDDYPLLQCGKPAHFSTCADAQRAADGHELDLYPNATAIDDGLSWLPDPEIDWRSIPHRVEERANWQRRASKWLP